MVLTSNRTREVHDALKRRCLYHWVEHPDFEREVAIVRRRAARGRRAAGPRGRRASCGELREADLLKPPGVAETIDWAQALHVLGAQRARRASAAERTLGAVLKYREDQPRVERDVLPGAAGDAEPR